MANSTKFFTPFGEYRIEPPSPVDGITDQGYTGHKHNDEIGLIYMNARFYVPSICRFASADTLIPYPNDPQSHNRYSYVRNNALNSKDPTGHIDCIDPEEPCVPVIAPQAEPFPVCLEVYCEGVLPLDAGVTVDGPIQNNVSLGRKIFATSLQINGIFLDIIELNASLIGVGGQPLAALAGTPIGASVIAWLVERFGADFAETLLSNVTLLNTIIADIVAGYSYIDKDTNELVVGQSTILGMIEMGLDGLVPASPEFDLFLNSFMLIYDIVDLLGAPNIIEYRIPIYNLPQPRLFFGKGYFVIYDFE